MAVFSFHGVGGDQSINSEREEHRRLLAWLAANRAGFWTALFLAVTEHIRAERKRLEWEEPRP